MAYEDLEAQMRAQGLLPNPNAPVQPVATAGSLARANTPIGMPMGYGMEVGPLTITQPAPPAPPSTAPVQPYATPMGVGPAPGMALPASPLPSQRSFLPDMTRASPLASKASPSTFQKLKDLYAKIAPNPETDSRNYAEKAPSYEQVDAFNQSHAARHMAAQEAQRTGALTDSFGRYNWAPTPQATADSENPYSGSTIATRGMLRS